MSAVRIIHADWAACRFCNRGARAFCRRHGIDWSRVIAEGVEVSEVAHIDDEMLRQVIARAEQRTAHGQKTGEE